MAIGKDYAPYTDYLRERADQELDIAVPKGNMSRMFQRGYVATFGIPEIGVQERIDRVLSSIPSGCESLVDIGCGAGILLAEMRRRHPAARLKGVELDEPSCAIARAIVPKASIVCVDAMAIASTLEDRFEVATCVDVLEHIPDGKLAAFVKAAHAMLLKGGVFIVHVPQRDQRRHLPRFRRGWSHHDHEREGFTRLEIAEILRAGDFEIERMEETFGFLGSLAWEANMSVAGGALHALVFPFAIGLCRFDRWVRSKRYNGVIAIARRVES